MANEDGSVKNTKKALLETTSLPASLINTYFQIFEVAVNSGKKESDKKRKKQVSLKNELAMKGRLLGALLTGVNRAHPYLPAKDTGMEQHVDSLYRIAHVSPPTACTQALLLLFHVAVGSSSDDNVDGVEGKQNMSNNDKKSIKSREDRFYRVLYTKLADPSMFIGRQLTLFFNLIYKAMKYDKNSIRVVAFGKRLLHTALHNSPSVVSGALFLLSEVIKYQPDLRSGIFSIQGHGSDFDPLKREPSAAFSLLEPEEVRNEGDDKDANDESIAAASLWEISMTIFHYHPTVSKFSSSIDEINYKGDPLRDFGLVPFLDKFAFKNPKSTKKITEKLRRGESIGERRSGLQGNIQALSSLPVNDPRFWRNESIVSEQDEFFQKFFVERAKRDEVKGIVRGKKDKDETDELDALEAAEAKTVDFDWDTDEEEEAFVEKLAESLMEGSAETGKVNFDDEDPDMDDWSDYGGSDDESIGNDINESDLDALSDEIDDDDDDDNDEISVEEDDDDDDDDDLGMSLLEDEPESDEEGADVDVDTEDKNQKAETKKKKLSTFAAAEDYEELIMKSWMDNNDSSSSKRSHEKNSTNNEEKNDGKKRRRRR